MRGLLEMMFGRLQTGQMRALGVIKSERVVEAVLFPGPEVCRLSEMWAGASSDRDSDPIIPTSSQASALTSVRTATTQAPNPAR